MTRGCDNRSVGVVIERGGELALLRRAKFPIALAPPAGHIDEHGSPEQAAIAEVGEELGLVIAAGGLIRTAIAARKIANVCRRPGGDHHYWWVYKSGDFMGELVPSPDETRGAGWYKAADVQQLADRTAALEAHLITSDEWQQQPGLEPVWRDFLRELGYIA